MIILRHCESEFNRLYNLSGRDPCVPDPALSAHGQDHAHALVDELRHKNITRILVSPFTRTLQTATPIAHALGLTPQITPLVRERGMYSCDVGSPASALMQDWPQLDFAHLPEKWWSPLPESDRALSLRAQQFREQMRKDAPHEHTLVVSHWWFLLELSNQSLENGDWLHLSP
ncbi:histidine phosphatase family protein [Acetobacter sp. DsW_54]|uniref:histidine phosphatase family protein n=1 Tax=Acetobacter sp. DsW_54 TaxID=1670660 RepID=UPI000A3C5E85|nr:histidine phosphatase family protein [Acetobacter sp. DsW_54]OUJ00756.1 phosphoglycerate mutase [Acetobacter sp. DsW_54]